MTIWSQSVELIPRFEGGVVSEEDQQASKMGQVGSSPIGS